MNDKKIIISIIAVTVVILVGGVLVISANSSTSLVTASQNAKAYTVESTSFDWGKIQYNGGNVTKTFTIKNTGTDTLKIYNIKTSCHCTKAHLTINGKKSEDFGMSGVSSWVGDVATGKNAKLTVIFDPAYHGPGGLGPVSRFVSVETNDKGNPKLTFTLTGTVVK